MAEYNNDPSGINEEEVLEIHEEVAETLPEYDIFDLGEVEVLFEDRKTAEEKAESHNTEKESAEEIATVVYEDERYEQNNVTSVLPPYRRETTQRSTEDITELSKKRNSQSYEKPLKDTPLVDRELYEEPELGVEIDDLLKTMSIDIDKLLEAEKEFLEEKTQVLPNLGGKNLLDEEYDAGKTQVIDKLPEIEADSKTTRGKKDIGSTRHFNLKNLKPDRTEAEKKLSASRKNLMQNFRVLSKKRDDEAILEEIPVGDGQESMMDNIRAENGEDLFDAVERAERKKTRRSLIREEKTKAVVSGKAAEEELKKTLKNEKIQLITLGILFVAGIILSFIPKIIASSETPANELPSVAVFALFNMVLLGFTAFVAKDYYRSSAISLYYMTGRTVRPSQRS